MNTETLALAGAILVASAYVPQIIHLVKKHCAYGISLRAWLLWLVAALMLFPHTLLLGDRVLIFLFAAQIVAISFILVFSFFHQEKICAKHKHKFL